MLTPPDTDSDEEVKSFDHREKHVNPMTETSSAFDTMMFNNDEPHKLYEDDSSFLYEQRRLE